MHPRQHGRGGFPEQVELGGDAEHLVGVGIGPVTEGVGHQGDRNASLACLLAQQQGMAGITARLEHHQGAVFGAAQQHFAEVPGADVDQLHAIAQVLQQVAHAHGDAALGLEAGDEHPRFARQALRHIVPGGALAVFVYAHQGGDFQLQAAGVVAGVLVLAVILQAVAHQPRAIAQVVLQVLLQRLEMGITQ
ncbi:hypothetical protein D3C79_803030 [compost metagenome]